MNDYLDLKTMAGELGVATATLHDLLPDEIRQMMDTTGAANRRQYHRKYLPALAGMLALKDSGGRRAIKPATAAMHLRPLIQAINDGEQLVSSSVPVPVGESGIALSDSSELSGAEIVQRLVELQDRTTQALEQLTPTTPDKLLTKAEAMAEFGVSSTFLDGVPHAKDGRANKWNWSDVNVAVKNRFRSLGKAE